MRTCTAKTVTGAPRHVGLAWDDVERGSLGGSREVRTCPLCEALDDAERASARVVALAEIAGKTLDALSGANDKREQAIGSELGIERDDEHRHGPACRPELGETRGILRASRLVAPARGEPFQREQVRRSK